MPHIREFAQSRIIIDDRYLPLLISTFHGKTEVAAANWHSEVNAKIGLEAARRGLRLVNISDATRSERPDADARKAWAESTERQPAAVRDATLATFVVVTSPLIRGAITAIGWVNPKLASLETFPTLTQAIEEGLRRLERDGQRVPTIDPHAYEPPDEKARTG